MNWNKIDEKLKRSREKYEFYLGTYGYHDCAKDKLAQEIPKSHVGWGRRAVEMRANKTHFDCFENDQMHLNDILEKYQVIPAFEKLKSDILVAGCGFLALAYNRVMPFTAEEATGTYSWREQNLKDGVAVFARETKENKVTETRPDVYMHYDGSQTKTVSHNKEEVNRNVTGRPLIGLFTYNGTTKRPFGRSVLSRPARDAIIDASRTTRQAMIAAYHYNTKVDIILGADNETPVEKMETRTGDVLKIGVNAEGGIPQISQFAQHAMAPFKDTILLAAHNFCSDTKLNLANLGIDTDAPQSTEALEIVSDDLKDDILAWQEELGAQLKYFAVTLYLYENNIDKIDDNLQSIIDATIPIWKPVYQADVSKFGDGFNKIFQNVPNIVEARSIWRNLGLSSAEIDRLITSISNS